MFTDSVLMITGGTGSFGNAVLNRFLNTNIREIRIFSRDEKKQEDMRISLKNDKLKFYIGDIRNYDSISQAMHGVDYVFHAAALKQVPSCEFYPMEAVLTNVLGAENVMNAAVAKGVKRVVVLSTDKAVYPINAMGLSKEGDDGEAHDCQVQNAQKGRDCFLRYTLWQCNGIPWLSNSAVRGSD